MRTLMRRDGLTEEKEMKEWKEREIDRWNEI